MSLYSKALDCAIQDLKRCNDRDAANVVYVKWKCFHRDSRFREAVEKKKQELKQ